MRWISLCDKTSASLIFNIGNPIAEVKGWLINLRGVKDGERVNMWQETLVICFSDLHLHSIAKNKQYCGNAHLP
jgi:hypothetical protein